MFNSKKFAYKFIILSAFFLITFSSSSYANDLNQTPIFIVGQDLGSINDFISSLDKNPQTKKNDYPDGFMTYTAINDLKGLSEPADQGAGINFANQLIQAQPKYHVIQIGLYMCYMLKEVVTGGLDKNILKLGQWIKNSDKDVYLRIGYEFDNPDNNYDPQDYIQAYRYIVDHLRQMNVTNVHYVWHTIAWKDTSWPAYDPMKWYPGDQYVDWVGISFFDPKRDDERNAAADLARRINKPLMIAESSPFNQNTDEEKLQWIEKLFNYIRENHVKFLSYINVNWDSLPLFKDKKWGDARLQNSPILMQEWLKQIEEYRLDKVPYDKT